MYGGPPTLPHRGHEATNERVYGFRPRPSGALLDSWIALGQQMASEARAQAGLTPRLPPPPWT
eukprot:1615232-Heterocapsa_arctica.AAC.1